VNPLDHAALSARSCRLAGASAATSCCNWDDLGMEEMTSAYAIRAGGWDARYAVVRALTVRNDIAAVLVDPNGDGGSTDLDEYRRGPDGRWEAGTSGGSAGDSGTSWSPWMVVTYGRTEPGASLLVVYDGETHTVTADGEGWWLFATESVDEDTMPVSRAANER
jgi:hypothetical protein